MRTPLIVGNWKMNGSLDHITTFARTYKQQIDTQPKLNLGMAEVVICPPALYLAASIEAFKTVPITVGAQGISEYPKGAFTGDISANMVVDIGAKYVLIGHSERRQYHQENDAQIAKMAELALNAGLKPIVCVGESQQQRRQGETNSAIEQQARTVIEYLLGRKQNLTLLSIAYEPIWAIGTGDTASPAQAQAVHSALRALLVALCGQDIAQVISLLYGGSVNPENAGGLLSQDDIDGALVGGAALEAQSLLSIVGQAAQSS